MSVTINCGECGKTLGSEPVYSATNTGPRYCRPCWQIVNAEELANEAKIDRWHDGYFANRDGAPRPDDPDEADGWDHREREKGVHVLMPARPEGYYHAPLGTFD